MSKANHKILGWEGFSFIFLSPIALGVLQLDMYPLARILFGFSSLALLLKLAKASREYTSDRYEVYARWGAVALALIYTCGVLYLVSCREAKMSGQPRPPVFDWVLFTISYLRGLQWGWILGTLIVAFSIAFVAFPVRRTETVSITKSENREEWMRELSKEYDLIKLQPNIVHSSQGEVVDAHWGENKTIVKDISDAENLLALVIPHQNSPDTRPKRRITSIIGVIAEITFTDVRKRVTRPKVPHSAWLSEKGLSVDFGITKTHDLIVVVLTNGRDVSAARREFHSTHPNGVTTLEPLEGDLFTVRIRLMTEQEGFVIDKYEMILEVITEPNFKTQLTDAIIWKSGHLHGFIDESFGFSKSIHSFWEDADKELPLPPTPPPASLFQNYALAAALGKEEMPPAVDFFEVIRQRAAFQRAKEEILIPALEDWQTRVAAFLDLWFGKEQSDKFVNCVPTFNDGLECKPRGSRLYRVLSRQGTAAQREPENWSLSDAVAKRRDLLMELSAGRRRL